MRTNRYIFTALMIISVIATLLLAGCAGKTTTPATPARKYQIAMVKDITDSKGAKWKIYQLRLTLDGGGTFTVDLNLTDGDRVELWYSTEKPTTGGSVDFKVKAGTATVYTSAAASTAIANTSDNLTFTAAQANGTSYRLVFHSNLADKNSKETILTEIKYTINNSGEDSIFIPLETN